MDKENFLKILGEVIDSVIEFNKDSTHIKRICIYIKNEVRKRIEESNDR